MDHCCLLYSAVIFNYITKALANKIKNMSETNPFLSNHKLYPNVSVSALYSSSYFRNLVLGLSKMLQKTDIKLFPSVCAGLSEFCIEHKHSCFQLYHLMNEPRNALLDLQSKKVLDSSSIYEKKAAFSQFNKTFNKDIKLKQISELRLKVHSRLQKQPSTERSPLDVRSVLELSTTAQDL